MAFAGERSLNNVAGLHVAMAVANGEYFEVLLPEKATRYGLVEDLAVDSDGLIHAPSAPGLGVEIDFGPIKKNRIAVLN